LTINPNLVANSNEFKRLLEEQLPLGGVQVEDVQKFLQEQGFSFSDLFKKDDRVFQKFYGDPTTFDSFIGCRVPGPPLRPQWRWPGWSPIAWLNELLSHIITITSVYLLQFRFLNNQLVEITVEQHFTGF
jgi:hypothetical protein